MFVGDKTFVPEIHLSVMVQGAQVESLSVLVQGYIVNPSNVVQLLNLIKERIHLIEDDWAVKAQEEDYNNNDHQYHSTRASLSWMLQNAVFALNSLPSDAAPVLVMVTDGVVDLFDAYSYDNLLMQLVRHDVHCHFLRVGGGENAPNSSFGFVPDVDLLRFIAGTTGGVVFDYLALHEACYGQAQSDDVKEMTAMQEACFVRTSSVHAISTPVLKLDELCCTSFDGRTLLPLRPYRMWREKVHEYRIFADVERIMEARIREGFTVNKVHIKTYQKPVTDAPTATTTNKRSPESPRGDSSGTGSAYRDVTKILVVFLLQWKQNVWLEYVVSSTTESTTTSTAVKATASASRRFSGQGLSSSGIGNSFSSSKPTHMFAKEQTYVGKWSEWYVKVNILAYSDFLRAFEDSAQMPNGNNALVASVGSGSPHFLHEYIRNVQDVDRVLLHLMTATAAAIAPVESGNQYSFGTSGNSSSSSVVNSRQQQNAHPVFNIIGELSPVLWHRWFYVERFELLCVVKNESCSDVFYRNEEPEVIDRARSVRKGFMNQSRGFLQLHGGLQPHTYNVAIGVERITERLMAAVQKWSSQRLSKDLFLRFLLPSARDKHLLRNKASGAGSNVLGMGKRQQRPTNSNAQIGGIGGQPDEPALIDGGSKSSLCFVRVEIKSKTLVAIHVAFFSTTAAARKQTLNDLKANIIAGLNDVPPSPLATNEQANAVAKSVVLSQRLISRLLVTHETLLLHDELDDSVSHDHSWESSGVQAVSSCCGGSELQLRSVFGSYMWHSSWRWHISNPSALLNVMRRLHEARIESGFWVLDWKMESDEDGQNPQLQSIIFGREILMEDENGNIKTSLVQYALRRVSETCLMTSIWMEPQHGLVKTQLSSQVEAKDKFHWGLRHAVGHDIPCEEVEFTSLNRSSASPVTAPHTSSPGSSSHMEDERRSMEKEDVSIDWHGSTYLGENDLLQLIRGYIFKSDRHFLSCLHTFDCVMNFREHMQHLSQMNKEIEDIVGSTWGADKLHAATLKQLLPPFSTTRLLRTSKRSAEHFLMYLENGPPRKPEDKEENLVAVDALKVSFANEHLYSMLERTLRGLSDCEVSWTDCNGNDISKLGSGIADWEDVDQMIKEGMSGQMPLWLKDHISPSFQDKTTQNTLSKGKCFAKLVGDDTVVLAFLPSLDTVQVRQKGPDKLKRRGTTSAAQFPETQTRLRAEPKMYRENSSPEIQNPAIEPNTSSRLMRMSVSADDIVLYQERRLSFREGYKSWRMGHYQGAKDGKQSTGDDFRNLRLTSTPEDHEFCEEISRQTDYGCDFHLLIEREDGGLGSGFFQVAFYECSITRLSAGLQNCNKKENASHLDLPQTILKQLFFSGADPTKSNKEPAATPATAAAKDARPKPLVQHSSAGALPTATFPSPMIRASSVAARRFQKKVKRAHEHNFSRGVYIALREGSNVQQSDLLQALTSCIEVPVDLDITLLYRMMQATSSKRDFQSLVGGNQRVALKEKLDKAFEKILSSLFIPIPGTKYYYFTGSEVATFEDSADGESDLHLLMDDSDEVSSSTVPEDDVRPVLTDSVQKSRPNIETSPATVFSPASKPPLPKASPRAALSNGTDVVKAGRRFNDLGRPPPVKTSATELPPVEQHPGVEEDAEFNKEVAVATSIFSAPFFFRFECREISTPRVQKSSTSEAVSASRDGLHRSSSTQSFVDMRKDLGAKAGGGVRDEFQARFDSLLSKKDTQEEMIAQVAEWFGKAASSRIALRLITLTLPTEQLVDPSRQPVLNQQMPFEMDDSVHGGKLPLSRAQVISTLPLFQRQALKRVRKDIKEWCSVEVLDILRAAKKITPSISQLVQRLFEDLPPQTLTKAKYPLEFVATSQDALGNPVDLFKKELERGTLLRVHELNGVYYVIDSKQTRECKSSQDAAGDAEADSFEIPFWAYLTVENDHVALHLHHPDRFAPSSSSFDRLGVLTRLHMGVMDACKRVNQFLLLLQLHETRTCNGYLLPGSNNQVSSPRSPRRRDSASNSFGLGVSEHFFWPGQFQCDLQYSAFFKLHERLSASMALNILCTSALEQFQVHNRRYMFVYRDRGGHVFYMKISIKHDEQAAGQEKVDRRRVTRIGSGTLGGMTPSSSAPTSSGAAGILLEVFGVCTAGEEVTHELCRVLERKLDEATQLILMKLLARNAKFQLSSSDMTFVCPSGGKPAQVIEFVLPSKLHGVSSLLHFLSQTFSSAPYIRHVSNVGSSSRAPGDAGDSGVTRGGRRQSLQSGPADKHILDAKPKAPGAHNPGLVHPSLFFVCDNPTDLGESNSGSDVISPVFMSPRHSTSPGTTVKPKIVDQVSYVLNLNPELRLSPGFLSRIGRGLAVLHIELIQDQVVETQKDGDGHVVKSLEGFDSASRPESELVFVAGTHQVIRCQLWIRGSINTNELARLVESNLREAMLDYQIEATLKTLSASSTAREASSLPQEVVYLTSLFERSCSLSSASVTKLVLPTSLAPWDVQHVVRQLHSFLRCVPAHLRPVVYSKRAVGDVYKSYEIDLNLENGEPWIGLNNRQCFRLIARLGSKLSESRGDVFQAVGQHYHHPPTHSSRGLHLNHSDSIQSNLSEMESVSNKLSLTWTSMSGSDSNVNALTQSNSSNASMTVSLSTVKEFSENELLLYPNIHAVQNLASSSSSVDTTASGSSFEDESSSNRSFYYVIDVSCTDGVQVYGYNMSNTVVDTILVQFARILTWAKLRESLLRNLLLEKSGLSRAAPFGSNVVHPRDLYMGGGGSAMGKNSFVLPKDFCVNFVEFWRPAMMILTGNAAIPRLLDSALLRSIEGSSLGKYLREAHTVASDRDMTHRPRAPSNASLQAGNNGPPDLHREVLSQSSSRSLRGENTGQPKNMSAIGRGGSSTGMKMDRTLPSPKRGMPDGPTGAYPSGNSGAAAANPRMRANVGAANALLAARARARGALPGRLGGPGTSSKPADGADLVAPWDLPLTNTKGPVLTGSGAPDAAGAGAGTTEAPTSKPPASIGLPTDAGAKRPAAVKAGNALLRELGSPVSSPVHGFGPGFTGPHLRQNSSTLNDAASVSFSWRKQLEFAWGPRFKYHDGFASSSVDKANKAIASSDQLRKNPLLRFSDAFQNRWRKYEDRSTSHTICVNLFDKLVTMKAGEEMDEPIALSVVDRMMQGGHQLVHQRFRVTFVERWEVIKVDEEYMEEDMQDGRLRALQASMDLVNLLSYKKEFVFAGNECTIANFYTEHTVLGMCANEGDAVREMKKQIMKNIFHLKMEVAHDFYEQYAIHLRALGFRHLRTLTNNQSSLRAMPTLTSSTSLSSLSVVDMVASDGEGFTEYFYFPGKSQGKMKGWQALARGSTAAAAYPATLLLLELKCDHHGVRLGVVLVNESDLLQQDMGFQSRLQPKVVSIEHEKTVVSGEMVRLVSTWLRETLRTRAIVYSFTIRFFQKCLTKWSNDQHERRQATGSDDAFDADNETMTADSPLLSSSLSSSQLGHDVQSFQNIVKGVRCFLHAYPEPPSAPAAKAPSASASSSSLSTLDRGLQQRGSLMAQQNSLLRTAVVELPPTQLHSNCSESILVKILLRYIACHGARYEVLDLMQFGTPDAVVCHSPSGSFFHRHPSSSGPKPFGYLPPRKQFNGYSLLITTQSLAEGFGLQAHDKKRRKNCIQLILLKSGSGGPPLGVGNGVLPVERALMEAEFFVQELFRVAAQHYERDLLWSRLLYDDTTGPGAKVASTLALPANHFQVEVGPQQLEECLRLSVCTPLEEIDPTLAQLLAVDGVCWQEFALRLRDLYADQLREYQFAGEKACHFLLLCPNTHDLIIHLMFENGLGEEPMLDFVDSAVSSSVSSRDNYNLMAASGSSNATASTNRVKIEICRREEPPNRRFTFAQRRVITDFVNSIVHWQWRSLLYD